MEFKILLDNLQRKSSDSHLTDVSTSSLEKVEIHPDIAYSNSNSTPKVKKHSGPKPVDAEEVLTNYPTFKWQLCQDENNLPQFKNYHTISRHLFSEAKLANRICPYGDEPATIARVEKKIHTRVVRDAYTLSALRFEQNPFSRNNKISSPDNKLTGIPERLKSLYKELSFQEHPNYSDHLLKVNSLQNLKDDLAALQHRMRHAYLNELVPLMNANPLDLSLHTHELSLEMMHDLGQYVQLQNNPHTFFDLMQWLERDVAIFRWQSFQSGHMFSIEEAITFVMTGWRTQNGHRRKNPIKCPVGVPIGYMQSLRRKDQPFITQEFADHAHGALNHWLQEHIWQRFCYRYPEKSYLLPSTFLKRLGYLHFAFADAIYELHMTEVANPANTNFWSVLQYYLPLMSPWP